MNARKYNIKFIINYEAVIWEMLDRWFAPEVNWKSPMRTSKSTFLFLSNAVSLSNRLSAVLGCRVIVAIQVASCATWARDEVGRCHIQQNCGQSNNCKLLCSKCCVCVFVSVCVFVCVCVCVCGIFTAMGQQSHMAKSFLLSYAGQVANSCTRCCCSCQLTRLASNSFSLHFWLWLNKQVCGLFLGLLIYMPNSIK